jgi:hypothetical protein
MKKRELLYSNLLRHLDSLLIERQIEDYFKAITDPILANHFIELVEEISVEFEIVKEHFDKNVIYSGFNNFQILFDSFNSDFSTFPNLRYHEFAILLEISKKISSTLTELDDQDIEVDKFGFIECSQIEFNECFFYNHKEDKKILCLLNFKEIDKCKNFINETSFSLLFLFNLNIIICGNDVKANEKYLILDKSNIPEIKDVISILNIHLISEGHLIHKPKEYINTPLNNYRNKLSVGNKYQQFNDIINIFSEYNQHTDIFDKYLRLYQIFENFMCRYPIVNLENLRDGKIFSIRDFRLLYQKIEKTEKDSINDLFSEIYKLKDPIGKDYKIYLKNLWKDLSSIPDFDKLEINKFLKNLKIVHLDYDKIKSIHVNEIGKFYNLLIYNVRNSIVHNKETEFHLTHKELNDSIFILISKFLIPSLEEFIFKLVSEYNPIVWYKNSKLILFED